MVRRGLSDARLLGGDVLSTPANLFLFWESFLLLSSDPRLALQNLQRGLASYKYNLLGAELTSFVCRPRQILFREENELWTISV